MHVTPSGAIKANGTVKLKYQTVEDPVRLAQIEEENRQKEEQLAAQLARQPSNPPVTPRTDPQAEQRARDLVQRAVGTNIDRYFYLIDKDYRQKNYVFLVSQRIYAARLLPDGTYQVTCHAQVQSGASANQLKSRTLSCGMWNADLAKQKVSPADSTARKIKAQANS